VPGGGGECPPDSPEALFIELVNVNRSALAGLQINEPVSLINVGGSVIVSTLLGTMIGDVRSKDVETLTGRKIRRSRVFVAEEQPPRCIIEVTI